MNPSIAQVIADQTRKVAHRVHIHDVCDHATYDRNRDGPKGPKGDQLPCAICGQGVIAKTTYWVHMRTDGHLLKHGDTVSDAEDQGCFPIGPNCYKRHSAALRGYVTRLTESKEAANGVKTEYL